MQISKELNTIISYAREEAMRTGCYNISADHLFLGILRHGDNQACRVMEELDVNLEAMKCNVEQVLFHQETIPYCDDDKIRLDLSAKKILSLSIYEALAMYAREASSIHLLLSLCKHSDSVCKKCLESIDIDAGVIAAYLKDCHGTKSDDTEKRPAPKSKPNKLQIIGTISIKPSDIYS